MDVWTWLLFYLISLQSKFSWFCAVTIFSPILCFAEETDPFTFLGKDEQILNLLERSVENEAEKKEKKALCKTCNKRGTELCNEAEGVCHCNPNYMGEMCKMKRNACEVPYHLNRTGNELCGDGIRGVCAPELGTPKYFCECKKGFSDDPKTDTHECVTGDWLDKVPLEIGLNPIGIKTTTRNARAAIVFTPFVVLIVLLFSIAVCVEARRRNKKKKKGRKQTSYTYDEEEEEDYEESENLTQSNNNGRREDYAMYIPKRTHESLVEESIKTLE